MIAPFCVGLVIPSAPTDFVDLRCVSPGGIGRVSSTVTPDPGEKRSWDGCERRLHDGDNSVGQGGVSSRSTPEETPA